MNKGLNDELKEAFPDAIPVPRPLVVDQKNKKSWLISRVY